MKMNEAIILSMTPQERQNPSILKASRKNRIARGSGTKVADVNRVLSQYEKIKQMMKQMSGMAKGGKMPNMMGQMKAMNKMRAMQGGKYGKRRF